MTSLQTFNVRVLNMMQSYHDMGWGMGLGGLLALIAAMLVIAALIKYLRS